MSEGRDMGQEIQVARLLPEQLLRLPAPRADDPRTPTGLFVGPVEDPDRYEWLGRRLGERGEADDEQVLRGGESVVFRARDTRPQPGPGEDVAVKMLTSPGGSSRDEQARWEQRIRLLALADSPHLVRIVEYFSGFPPHPPGTCRPGDLPPPGFTTRYVVMEWVEGRTLQDLVSVEGIRLVDGFRYIIDVAEALDSLHAGARSGEQLLHRDVKPDNIIVHRSRSAVLVDFGLARVVGPAPTVQHAFAVGYTAPEVLGDFTRYSVRSDLWSLGAVAYFIATGGPPGITADDAARRQRLKEAASAHGVKDPRRFVDLMMQVLASDPQRRWPGKAPRDPRRTAQSWAQTVYAAIEGTDPPVLEPRRRRSSLIIAAVVALVLAAIAFTAGRSSRGGTEGDATPERPTSTLTAIPAPAPTTAAPGQTTSTTTAASSPPSTSAPTSTVPTGALPTSLPSAATLTSLLVTQAEVRAFPYSPSAIMVSGRRGLFDPRSHTLCTGVTVSSAKTADDSFQAYDGRYSNETMASEATSFYAGGANEYLQAVREAVQRCGLQVRPNATPLGDEVFRFTFGGQNNAPFGDMVLFRKGCVVVQVLTDLFVGDHSRIADELAATVAKRASTLISCT